ncbi:FKBP-type peptidyl-prolyl cis-trans isomerase [Nocardioides taihuensis]|uniref:Peptidyl-prolyl cis-trans isomerase n=1 Tax=Nocardioides taihuensis TaxID=1835606 RepID=A0ABW0BIA7_9ACTN
MSRRTRRVLPLLLTAVLALGLSGCGNDDAASDSDSSSGGGLDSVTIGGDFGKAPEITWDGQMEADEVTAKVISEGDGEEVAEGDAVLTNIWVGNGYTQEQAFSTYDEGGKPQIITVTPQGASEVFIKGLEGQKIGSRIAVAASAEVAFGPQGNPNIGVANKDTVLFVLDLMEKVPTEPEGKAQPAPSWAPKVEETDGDVTGLDMSSAPKPDGELKSAVLIEGTGPKVEKGQTITVNYLGQTYTGDKPFDESYTSSPASFAIGVGQVVPGWDKTLVGQRVGSRVILAIPPEEGYGKQGQPDAGISGTDTLYFVVDILGAS